MNNQDMLEIIQTMPNGHDGPLSVISFDFFCEFFSVPGNDQWVEPRGPEEFDEWCVWCAASV